MDWSIGDSAMVVALASILFNVYLLIQIRSMRGEIKFFRGRAEWLTDAVVGTWKKLNINPHDLGI